MTGDIRAISAQVGVVTDTLIDAIREIENYDLEDSISDTSEENIDQVTSGRLLSCSNTAAISGDLNVGGVAGSMAVEYELDPEDDLISNSAPIYRRAYELKAILQRCTNTGAVVGRRDHVGSVCGRMDLGLILESPAMRWGRYGRVLPNAPCPESVMWAVSWGPPEPGTPGDQSPGAVPSSLSQSMRSMPVRYPAQIRAYSRITDLCQTIWLA